MGNSAKKAVANKLLAVSYRPPWRPTPDYQTVDYFLPASFLREKYKRPIFNCSIWYSRTSVMMATYLFPISIKSILGSSHLSTIWYLPNVGEEKRGNTIFLIKIGLKICFVEKFDIRGGGENIDILVWTVRLRVGGSDIEIIPDYKALSILNKSYCSRLSRRLSIKWATVCLLFLGLLRFRDFWTGRYDWETGNMPVKLSCILPSWTVIVISCISIVMYFSWINIYHNSIHQICWLFLHIFIWSKKCLSKKHHKNALTLFLAV